MLRRFDKVSTISAGMLQRAGAKGVDSERMLLFPNWSDMRRAESPEALVGGIRQALGMPVPNPVAREYARRFLEKEAILGKFEGELVGLVGGE